MHLCPIREAPSGNPFPSDTRHSLRISAVHRTQHDNAALLSLNVRRHGLSTAFAPTHQECRHASRWVLPLWKGSLLRRGGFPRSIHAVLLLDLPQDCRRGRLCHQPWRADGLDEGQRQALPENLSRSRAERVRQGQAQEFCSTLLLRSLRECPVGLGSDLARARSSPRRCHRYPIADPAGPRSLPCGLAGSLGRR